MIDSILKAIDKIGELVKLKADRRNRVFTELVKPTFDQLSQIHQDYRALFDEFAAKARDQNLSISDLESWLRARRRDFEIAREHARALAVRFKYHENDRFNDFFMCVCQYFFPILGPLDRHSTASSRIQKYLRDMDRGTVSREILETVIEEELDHIEEAWKELLNEYAELQMRYGTGNI